MKAVVSNQIWSNQHPSFSSFLTVPRRRFCVYFFILLSSSGDNALNVLVKTASCHNITLWLDAISWISSSLFNFLAHTHVSYLFLYKVGTTPFHFKKSFEPMYLQTTKNNIDYSNIYKGGSGPSENRSVFTNQKIGNAPQKRSKCTNEFSELLKKDLWRVSTNWISRRYEVEQKCSPGINSYANGFLPKFMVFCGQKSRSMSKPQTCATFPQKNKMNHAKRSAKD